MIRFHYLLWAAYAVMFIGTGALFEGLVDHVRGQASTATEIRLITHMPVQALTDIRVENL